MDIPIPSPGQQGTLEMDELFGDKTGFVGTFLTSLWPAGTPVISQFIDPLGETLRVGIETANTSASPEIGGFLQFLTLTITGIYTFKTTVGVLSDSLTIFIDAS